MREIFTYRLTLTQAILKLKFSLILARNSFTKKVQNNMVSYGTLPGLGLTIWPPILTLKSA